MHIGPGEIIFVLLVVLLLYGSKRLPEVARSLGAAIKEFKKAGKTISDDSDESEEK